MRLNGNTILISGGGTGIGRELALQLAARDNTVIICGRRQEKLDETCALNPAIFSYRCDLTDDEDRDQLHRRLRAEHPSLNVLINNAAVLNHYHLGKAEQFDFVAAETELQANLSAPIALTQRLLAQLLENPDPCIINVGSPGGVVAVSPTPLYSASKAGLHAYTQVLRLHLKGRATVIEVFPPTVETDMTTRIRRGKVTSESCASDILKGLAKNQDEVWIGEGRVLRWMVNLLPPRWVFKLVNNQPSMSVDRN